MTHRTWKTVAAAALIGPALMTLGCKSGGDAASGEAPAPAVLAEPVTVLGEASGSSEALGTIGAKLIRTQADYDALGDAEIFSGVDFEANDLVIVSLGKQDTAGYTIEITGLQLVGDELAVAGKATAPDPGAFVPLATTYPYAAVVIPNTTASQARPYID